LSAHDVRPAPGALLASVAPTLQTLVTLGAVATGLTALWLCFVTLEVLPARDPHHIPMWAGIATALLGYAALTLGFVARRPQSSGFAVAVAVSSLGAMAFGAYAVIDVVQAMRTGASFEGYLLPMGVIFVASGACTLAYTAVTQAVRPS